MVFQGDTIESVFGLAILAGTGAWMLHSGSFTLPGRAGENESVAQFSVIRKDGDAVLVINLHLPPQKNSGRLRRKQLQAILSHPVLDKQFSVILLCGVFSYNSADIELALLKKKSPYAVRDGFLAGGAAERQQRRESEHIFVLEENKRPAVGLQLKNSRLLFSQTESGGHLEVDYFGVALDVMLSRLNKDETSQVYRYAAYTLPWPGKRRRECT